MGIYLVDYENVHNDGVTDIQKLSASDRVVIFYGDSIKSIPFETHVEMMASKAAIEYIETHKVAKNYLDFQLATYLGFLIGKGEAMLGWRKASMFLPRQKSTILSNPVSWLMM